MLGQIDFNIFYVFGEIIVGDIHVAKHKLGKIQFLRAGGHVSHVERNKFDS